MLKELLVTASLFQVCPGTDYRFCGDKTPKTYSEFVYHQGNHDDGQNVTSPGREPEGLPTPPVREPEICR